MADVPPFWEMSKVCPKMVGRRPCQQPGRRPTLLRFHSKRLDVGPVGQRARRPTILDFSPPRQRRATLFFQKGGTSSRSVKKGGTSTLWRSSQKSPKGWDVGLVGKRVERGADGVLTAATSHPFVCVTTTSHPFRHQADVPPFSENTKRVGRRPGGGAGREAAPRPPHTLPPRPRRPTLLS